MTTSHNDQSPNFVPDSRQRGVRRRLLLTTALAFGSFSSVALAEQAELTDNADSNTGGISEIIVTAEKRATSLQKTPLAVSAVQASSLQEQHVEVVRDLVGQVAGLVAPGTIQNMQGLYIRGIGTTDPGVYPAVAIYFDDVYIPRTFGNALFDLPDIERVEVLRGPQGTLYGMNTSAGAIRYISRDPKDELQGSIDAGIGNLGALETHEYVTGPIVPGLLDGSFAFAHRQRDGYTHDPVLNRNLDAIETDQFRAKLRWTPDFGLDAVLSVDGSRDLSDNASYISMTYPGSNPRTVFAGQSTSLKRYGEGVTLKADYPIDDDHLTVRSISAVRGFHDDPSPWDEDGTPVTTYGWSQWIHEREYSQEFQLNGTYGDITFTTGVAYLAETFTFDRVTYTNSKFVDINSHLADQNYGIYGQVTYTILDGLSVTGGLRVNEDRQDFSDVSYNDNSAGVRLTRIYTVDGLHDSWRAVTPKISLNYQVTPDILTYLSWTEGQKAGGYNRAAATALIAQVPVSPENVSTYEAGLKARGWDGRVQANVAVFYNRFEDYQATITNPLIGGVLIPGSVLANAGKAHTYGAEIEATILPISSLEVKFTGAYLITGFDEFVNPTGAATSNFTGNHLPNAPKFTLGVAANYTLPESPYGTTVLNAKFRQISGYYSDVANTSFTQVHQQTYVDIGVHHTLPDEAWTIGVSVNNLLDATYKINGVYSPTIPLYTAGYNPPRTIVGNVRYSF